MPGDARPGDARQTAATILARLDAPDSGLDYCGYGTGERLALGIGRKSSLVIDDFGSLDSVWAQIDGFIKQHAGEYILGFIGFDPGNQLGRTLAEPRHKLDLFVPETVIECHAATARLVSGELPFDPASMAMAADVRTTDAAAVDTATLDSEKQGMHYAAAVSHALQAIEQGRLERATLARKLHAPWPLDLLQTFLADQSSHALSRSFLFASAHISFAGQSPELLADGDCSCFQTHKLSGTMARDAAMESDRQRRQFTTDPRIVAEHHSAIATIEHTLGELGELSSEKFMVMELPTLLHGWSRFTTRPHGGAGITDCLRSIFPYGLNPLDTGFELLHEHEDFDRGPYYGLVGCITPAGEFTFSQVLRSAFTDAAGSYVIAGAAITGLSTPELELEETRTKMRGIRIFPRKLEDYKQNTLSA